MIDNLTEDEQEELYALALSNAKDDCEASLFEFVKYFWGTIVDDMFIPNWHIKYICDEVQKVLEWVIKGEIPDYNYLVINVPPGSTKTTICSIMAPVWLWVKAPGKRLITSCHGIDLANEHSVKSRDVIQSPKFQEIFQGKIEFKCDQNNKGHYQNTANGSRMTASPSSKVIGRHAHAIFCDDLIDRESKDTELGRKKANDFLSKTLSTRKTDKKRAVTFLIMQRLHEMDPTGLLIELAKKKGGGLKLIVLPSELTDLKNVQPPEMALRYKKKILDPIRGDRSVLADAKIELGTLEYVGQYLQSPRDAEGNIIQLSWFNWYDELPMEKPSLIIQSWDTAFKKGQENDYSVCTTWYVLFSGYYLVDCYEEKLIYPELKKKMVMKAERFKPHWVLVEDKGSGTSSVQELSRKTVINFKWILPEVDKTARLNDASPTIEAGNVYLPNNKSWTDRLTSQITGFPNVEHDDIVDSVTQFINFVKKRGKLKPKDIKVSKPSPLTKGYDA